MLYKAPRARRPKASPRQLEKRELQDVDRVVRAAGGWEQLRQQHEEWCKRPRPKRGRRPITSDEEEEFWAVFGDWFTSVPHRIRKKFIAEVWQSSKAESENKALPPAVRKAWDPRYRCWLGGGIPESIVRRLEKRRLPTATPASHKTRRV
jgi:hypothetical protein